MALPLLPGNSLNRNVGQDKFHKSHHLERHASVSMLVNLDKPGIGGQPLPWQKRKPEHSAFPRGESGHSPAWVAFDKQVLSFQAYFQEAVNESRQEQYRIRECKVYFYLEDDSIQVLEPSVKNSGIPQGTLIRRHRIPLPPPRDEDFYTVHHFNVGNEMLFYDRKFKLTDCDQFTMNFLRKIGVRVNPPEKIPQNPYTNLRREMIESMHPLRPYERSDTLKQFLDHDGEVLRFYGYWDDTESLHGDKRELVVHYFLADDTMEIREVMYPNAGRDVIPSFLRRAKLPKLGPLPLKLPGVKTARTVLNVFGPMGRGGRYILDNLKTGAVTDDFYTTADLAIGGIVNAWGRKVVLCDCDEFTKNYYRTKFAIDDFTPIKYKADPEPKAPRPVPPYTGFGSEEDSLCSCISLVPKPPQKDFIKFMEKDRNGLESHVLRFVAYMRNDSPIDNTRKFIISYYLADDTIGIFESPLRNSGILGGKFLERSRMKKPGQDLFKSELSEYFKANELFVGAKVIFNEFNFIIVDADEYAFRYMEEHCDQFPNSNINLIIGKLREIAKEKSEEFKQFFVQNDPEDSGGVTYESLRNLLADTGAFAEHEIMSIGRHYACSEPDPADMNLVLAVAHERLKRSHFVDFRYLAEALSYADMERTGSLSPAMLRVICKSFKMPIPETLLQILISKSMKNGTIDYNDFVFKLNWCKNPVNPVHYRQQPIKLDEAWLEGDISNSKPVVSVRYQPLVDDLFGK